MKIPKYDEDPTTDDLNARHEAEFEAEEDASETLQVREGVHNLFLIACTGTTHDIYRAMSVAFAPPTRAK